ncbi:HNH endonuclease signature motif containing protein [Microcella humidisoli]|uniref:HNH endonuclease n=1 Tax=Microcella humidisoli TaxID=2963406 RepID=A0ABY5FU68_9MICO|nr:HNH endonuclease signature motif containing protein [Microcella humidisoli]UTT61838.1 HNH endonuclease [Microcella humidisoli]
MPHSNTATITPPGADAMFDVPALGLYAGALVGQLADEALLDLQSRLAELRRRTDTNLAVVADEIARRSHHSLGHDGLAQRLGSRTPQALVQHLTGTSARDAAALVRVGSMLGATDSEPAAPARPWLEPIAAAVSEARVSVEAGDTIARSLGEPDDHVTAAQLASAATQLVAEAALLTLEQLAVRARNARALLDLDGQPELVAEREQSLRDRRYLFLSRQADGMTRLSGLLDPESAALVRDAVDGATSPRRGGPRFVSPGEVERAERITRDARTTEQLALDALVELVRIGGDVAPTEVIGTRSPAVQVIVAERDVRARRGLARIDGQTEPVSIDTADRHGCSSGVVPIVIDARGDVVALGRETRLYTRRQRLALAARDGGCRFPGCERPPSWTEAHHIVPWSEGGATDLADGVLLCRHHHLLLHNNGWRFERRRESVGRTGMAGDLVLIPPRSIDPEQRPIPAPSKSPIIERERALAGAS